MRSRDIENHLQDIAAALSNMAEAINDSNIKVERLDASIITRDPGNARSAEEFAGLRKTIIQASSHRRQHISHLVSLLNDIEAGANSELLRLRITDFLHELGVTEVTVDELAEAFEASTETQERPALVHHIGDGTLIVVRKGLAPESVLASTEIPGHAIESHNPVATRDDPTPAATGSVAPAPEPDQTTGTPHNSSEES